MDRARLRRPLPGPGRHAGPHLRLRVRLPDPAPGPPRGLDRPGGPPLSASSLQSAAMATRLPRPSSPAPAGDPRPDRGWCRRLRPGSATVVPFLVDGDRPTGCRRRAGRSGSPWPRSWWPRAGSCARAIRRTRCPRATTRTRRPAVVVGNLLIAACWSHWWSCAGRSRPSRLGRLGLLTILFLRHRRTQLTERENQRLEVAHRSESDLAAQYRASLVALGTALEARDGYTGRHGEETVALAGRVAKRPGAALRANRRGRDRRAAPRRRQDRHPRRDPAQGRAARRPGEDGHA